MTTSHSTEALGADSSPRSVRATLLVRRAVGSLSGAVGLAVLALVVVIAFLGPQVAPHGLNEVVGTPFESPSRAYLLGTDVLGRDALSRFLYGGKTLLIVAFLATVLAYGVGISIGIASGYRRGAFDLATVGVADLLLCFPPIVFILVLLAAVGSHVWIIVLGIAVIHVPRIVRIVRAVTIDLSTREFVEASRARGESTPSILVRDILPNTWTPILADFGIRLSVSVWLFASLSFLGLGLAPPASDWGLMVSENRIGLTIQPWVILAPAAAIALLTISANLLTDAVNRNIGRSTLTGGA